MCHCLCTVLSRCAQTTIEVVALEVALPRSSTVVVVVVLVVVVVVVVVLVVALEVVDL